MHKMGLIGVWLVVLAGGGATLLTAKLIQVRDSYTKKLTTYQKQLASDRPKVSDMSDELAVLKSEFFRSAELWGSYWKDVPTTVQPGANGVVVIDIGNQVAAANSNPDGTRDVYLKEGEILYGFEILATGQTVYRGDFTLTTLRQNQGQLTPNWNVRPEDLQTWQPSAKWRWRNQIPPSYQSNYDEQILKIQKDANLLAERKRELDNENKLESQALDQLKVREMELTGGQLLPKDPSIAVELREGYVAALEKVEEERNSTLIKLDSLRRRLREVQGNIQRVKEENVELTRKLPQSGTPVSRK